jgi:hypothetical protein
MRISVHGSPRRSWTFTIEHPQRHDSMKHKLREQVAPA